MYQLQLVNQFQFQSAESMIPQGGDFSPESAVQPQQPQPPTPVCSPSTSPSTASNRIGDLITECITAKKIAGRRGNYTHSLEEYLRRFARAVGEDTPLDQITVKHVEDWISRFDRNYSKQTWLNRIGTLFSFAIRRGYIKENPCKRIDPITVDRAIPAILTVEQSRTLLKICPQIVKPWLILAMFAGIRPDGELMKMDWKEINLDTRTAIINHPKVRKHRRIVPLEPIAVDLLKQHPIKTGPVCPSRSTVRRFKRSARKVIGFKTWPADLLRHTAASFLLGLHKDAGRVATMLGNSPNILLNHYHCPVSDANVAEFWTPIKPAIQGNELEMTWRMDASYKITHVSPSISAILGYDNDEILGINVFQLLDLIHPADMADTMSRIHASWSDKIVRVMHQDGAVIEIKSSGTAIMKGDTWAGLNGSIVLLSKPEDLKVHDPDWHYQTDANGRIQFTSPSVRRILGYSSKEILNHNFIELVHPGDMARIIDQFHKHVAGTGDMHRWKCKDGSCKVLSTDTTPVFENGTFKGFRGKRTPVHNHECQEQENTPGK